MSASSLDPEQLERSEKLSIAEKATDMETEKQAAPHAPPK
jgi:hypothetical protein